MGGDWIRFVEYAGILLLALCVGLSVGLSLAWVCDRLGRIAIRKFWL